MHKYFNTQIYISNSILPKSFDQLRLKYKTAYCNICALVGYYYINDDKIYAVSHLSQQWSFENENHSFSCGSKH